MSWSRSVFSSSANEIGYDTDKNEMYVVWAKSGKRSIYSGVPEGLADEVSRSASVGAALREQIIGVYGHRYG